MKLIYLFFSLFALLSSCTPLVSSGVQSGNYKSFTPPDIREDGTLSLGLTDPLEEDPRYKEIFRKAEEETERSLTRRGIEPQLGYVHAYWDTKKKILRRYGIDWKTPAELNPFTSFD